MKASLLVLALIGATLAACTPSGPAPVPTEQSNVKQVSVEPGNYVVYQHCIRDVAYLTYARQAMIVQVTEDGKPLKCRASP